MPFIQNIALMDVAQGYHKDIGDNAMLIQIMDNDCQNFPLPKAFFQETHQFKFLDVEKDTTVIDPAMKISDAQATQLVSLLKHALDKNMNVIVHCHAGVCRSGAVCEVGVMMGFEDTKRYRQPNVLVKTKMMKVLGWTYE